MIRLGRTGTFWTANAVLVVCLWSAASPSVLYPYYADLWNLSELATTGAFAVYPLALLVVLLTLGGVSDRIGRKRAMVAGVLCVLGAAVLCALAPNIWWLYLGRIAQGVGTGLALSAASAALVENNPSRNPRWGSVSTTVATSLGLAVGVIVGGAFVQYVPEAPHWSYVPLLTATIPVLALLAAVRTDAPSSPAQRGSTLPRVPRGLVMIWLVSALSCGLAYGIGAIVIALGADMARDFTGTDNAFLVGCIMAAAFLCTIIAALFLGRVTPRTGATVGVILAGVSLVLAWLAAVSESLVVLGVWMVTAEVVFAFAFTGGIGIMNRAAPPEHRAAALSLVFLVAYLAQAATSVGIGALASQSSLALATEVAALVLGALCVATILMLGLTARRERRVRDELPTRESTASR